MDHFSFVLTVFFTLLGPIKIIPAFAGLMQGADIKFKREVTKKGILIASLLCLFVALAGELILNKYHISIDAVRLAGGLVLMLAALQGIFKKPPPPAPVSGTPSSINLAAAPVAVPIIVTPAGISAILIFTMLAPQYPGMIVAVAICLAITMTLNFLVMYFIDKVIKTPGLAIFLTVLGSVLVFIQLSLALQMVLNSLKSLGAISV